MASDRGHLRLRMPNARTEGYNRKIKQIKLVACGFRNQDSYERPIMPKQRRDRGVTTIMRSRRPRSTAKSHSSTIRRYSSAGRP